MNTKAAWAILACGLVLGFLAKSWLVATEQAGRENSAPSATTAAADPLAGLVAEKRQFVVNEYQLAVDLYKSHQFERCLYELAKLHQSLPAGYRDSKDYERYATEALEVSKKEGLARESTDAAEQTRREVAALIAQAEAAFGRGHYDEAAALQLEVVEKDPENSWTDQMKTRLEKARLAHPARL